MTILVRELRAEIERMQAENAELRQILQLAITLTGSNHCHSQPGIWDGSGEQCAECAVHKAATKFFSAQRQAMTKEQL